MMMSTEWSMAQYHTWLSYVIFGIIILKTNQVIVGDEFMFDSTTEVSLIEEHSSTIMMSKNVSTTKQWQDPTAPLPKAPGDTRIDLYITGLFPMEGMWAGGQAALPSVVMGLDSVNARPDVLPGYRLNLVWNNTMVS